VIPVGPPGLHRRSPGQRLRVGLLLLLVVVLVGTAGYLILGFSAIDAVYQTVITISTVGYREAESLSTGGKIFTIFVILGGVGTAAFTFSVLVELFVEGQISQLLGRRRMDRKIAGLNDHVIICGWGRVGRSVARWFPEGGPGFVVIDRDPARLATVPGLTLEGDATDDAILQQAGIDRARALVAALNADADNLYVTLSARGLRRDLFIVSRARVSSSEGKLLQAGANRVVNPQRLGGDRMAAFVRHPHVAEFLDVVMHDENLEFRLEEVKVGEGSPLVGRTLREANIREETGALVLALRAGEGRFTTNPHPEMRIGEGHILIAIGTGEQLTALETWVAGEASSSSS
jgi:voltage-gated potassium channel